MTKPRPLNSNVCHFGLYSSSSFFRLQLQSSANLTLRLLPHSKDMTQDTTKDLVHIANAVCHLSHMLLKAVFSDPFMSIHFAQMIYSIFLSFFKYFLAFLFIDTVHIASFKMLPYLSIHAMLIHGLHFESEFHTDFLTFESANNFLFSFLFQFLFSSLSSQLQLFNKDMTFVLLKLKISMTHACFLFIMSNNICNIS